MKKAEFNPPGAAIVPRGRPRLQALANDGRPWAAQGGGECLESVFCRTIQDMPKISPEAPDAALPATYEAALQELEQLVVRLESGQMPLDELLVGYRRGAALLALCKDKLQAVEDQIKVLDGGQLKTWDAA